MNNLPPGVTGGMIEELAEENDMSYLSKNPDCEHEEACGGINCGCNCQACFDAKLDRGDRLYDAYKDNGGR